MEPTKKNRTLLRPRTAKKRGNAISISSQLISDVPMITSGPEAILCMNNETALEESYLSIGRLDTSTSEQGNVAKRTPVNSIETVKSSTHVKRLRTDDFHEESFVVSLPSIALENRLDIDSSCYENKCQPGPVPLTGEIIPKNISLSVTNLSTVNDSGMSAFKVVDTIFDYKWGLRDCSPETSSSSSINIQPRENSAVLNSSETRLRVKESSRNVNNDDFEREKSICKSAFDLVRMMELRRLGLENPPGDLAEHTRFLEELMNILNKSDIDDDTTAQTSLILEKSPVVNQKVPNVEDLEPTFVEGSHFAVESNDRSPSVRDSCSTIEECDEALPAEDLIGAVKDLDAIVTTITSPLREDNENSTTTRDRPVLKRRNRKLDSWTNISEIPGSEQLEMSFKDRLNPIAAVEYDEMEVVELDMYDDLPNKLRSDVPKEFYRRWSAQDTEELYNCIALLGLDFGRIATVMQRTRKQITNKYKSEQKNNSQRLHNALTRKGEFLEFRNKYKF
ncbi:7338_t:CDS:1 [Funneliformis mosseae]|uniref:7338_t:CDS:1 n=1 Tax=Funneliformis mosseae TaxID=27381 RepID=A0A9N9AGY7_FUNMO|nr:7338_t:CDS:1 [Funneliformis mosseae]